MSRLTERYLPLPQPMSRPTEPGGRAWRKRSMMGQGWTISKLRRLLRGRVNSYYLVSG